MFKHALAVAAALGALGFNAPAVLADDPTYDCDFDASQADAVTGQNFEGAAWGYVIHAGDTNATIRCYVTVNGSQTATTPVGTGSTIGRVTFQATDVDDIDLCAEATTSHGTYTQCFDAESTQVPPQEVVDAADAVQQTINDTAQPLGGPLICGLIPPGHYPPDIYVDDDGDIYRDCVRVVDCPPYNDPDPPHCSDSGPPEVTTIRRVST